MDSSHVSPTKPPEDWARKFYKRATPGKFRSFSVFYRRHETRFALVFVVSAVGIFWYPILKPSITAFPELFRLGPGGFKREWKQMWTPKTKEEKVELLRLHGAYGGTPLTVWKIPGKPISAAIPDPDSPSTTV